MEYNERNDNSYGRQRIVTKFIKRTNQMDLYY